MNFEGFLKADVRQGVSNATNQEKYLKKYDIIWLTVNVVKDRFQSLFLKLSKSKRVNLRLFLFEIMAKPLIFR